MKKKIQQGQVQQQQLHPQETKKMDVAPTVKSPPPPIPQIQQGKSMILAKIPASVNVLILLT